jgi:hypothetical protein
MLQRDPNVTGSPEKPSDNRSIALLIMLVGIGAFLLVAGIRIGTPAATCFVAGTGLALTAGSLGSFFLNRNRFFRALGMHQDELDEEERQARLRQQQTPDFPTS